ncbi:predicted protein [Nematostella vectensis]|uniref:ABC transmembrane type-1 domain-containing protein n=1 Tax=Nematostella vectensis TaxID=45351 RepID=A7S9U1_NEMVE|nr:predicted protein [Nematostella vectensis]|eukprot:XP_001631602.1 predicted protein [Nematostella vectensis]
MAPKNASETQHPRKYALNWLFAKRLWRCLKMIFPHWLSMTFLLFITLVGLTIAEQMLVYTTGLIPSHFYEVIGSKDRPGFKALVIKAISLLIVTAVVKTAVRMNSEALAFYGSDEVEERKTNEKLKAVVDQSQRVANLSVFIDLSVNSFNNISTIVCYIFIGITVFKGKRVGGINGLVEGSWEDMLSPGEMQRLAFARLFYHEPDLAMMDEATSALDIATEKTLYGMCVDKGITMISIAHRETLDEYHDVHLRLLGDGKWVIGNGKLIKQASGY